MSSYRFNARSIYRIIAGAIALVLIAATAARAQVRTAPEGNSLPEQAQPDAAVPMDDHEHPQAVKLTREQHFAFASRVDTSRFRKLAVFDGGRAKIIDTLGREQLETIYGKPRWKDTWTEGSEEKSLKYDPVFTYLDLIFNKEYYADKAIIYVEVLDLREAMLVGLSRTEQEMWKVRGRLTPERLGKPEVSEAIADREKNVLMSKAISQVRSAVMAFTRPDARLYLVSPKAGDDQWKHLFELGTKNTALIADGDVSREVAGQFHKLSDAWAAADAPAVNAALNALSASIPRLNPATYPPQWKRDTEYVYNATSRFTIGYVGYLLGAIALLVAFAVRRRWLITTGIALLAVGFLVHTIGVAIRIVLAGRWPIHNQYESFIAITWLAVIAGSALMIIRRQWLYGAAAAALGAASLLFANTVDIPSKEVGQVAGILATSRILYVHVNMVLVSYGLIALGFFTSLFYLFLHYVQGRQAVAFAATGLGAVPVAVGGDRDASTSAGTNDEPLIGKQATLRDLDQAQMVILQLAFWLLGFGILLGAYWADHAWGRWWAWDPKETWALITWIVYLIVIHLRFTVKNRGLVTAWLSVIGFGVMLWTYWGVNLLLAGLHSYA